MEKGRGERKGGEGEREGREKRERSKEGRKRWRKGGVKGKRKGGESHVEHTNIHRWWIVLPTECKQECQIDPTHS